MRQERNSCHYSCVSIPIDLVSRDFFLRGEHLYSLDFNFLQKLPNSADTFSKLSLITSRHLAANYNNRKSYRSQEKIIFTRFHDSNDSTVKRVLCDRISSKNDTRASSGRLHQLEKQEETGDVAVPMACHKADLYRWSVRA